MRKVELFMKQKDSDGRGKNNTTEIFLQITTLKAANTESYTYVYVYLTYSLTADLKRPHQPTKNVLALPQS